MMKEFQTDRVNQLEAMSIDKECNGLLKESLGKAFYLFAPKTVEKFSAEMSLLVDFLYFRETVSKNNNLPGTKLQNVVYTSADCLESGTLPTKRKLLFFFVSVFGVYIVRKMKNYIQEKDIESSGDEQNESKTMKLFKKIVDYADKIYKVANLANFIVFLLSGKYRSIPERICQIQLKYVNPDTVRYLDFDLQNREIIWGIVSDLVHFILPLANDLQIFKALSKMFMFTTLYGSMTDDTQVAEDKCGVCEDTQITMPRRINNCKHLFCYYCITSYLQSQGPKQNQKCPTCNALFDSLLTPQS